MARVSRKQRDRDLPPAEAPDRIWKAALYVRLSVEDNGKDADSIENQTALLESYVSSHGFLSRAALFVDNGYTGTDFLRPGFQRMMEAVQCGDVDCVVVKDLSRLGRNYIETSRFIEKICPLYGLRFIAVNDRFDTAAVSGGGDLSASLSNIVNDFYAKDISRKVTSALRTKMERGEFIGNYAPHGYRKDPMDKNRLVVCPETAPVIRQIFAWRAQGVSYMGINRRLNDAGVPSPGQYRLEQGIETNNNKTSKKLLWNKHVIKDILGNMVYAGHMAQRKGSQCLYGGIPRHATGEDEWIVVRNTHEPIVSQELFDTVQEINRAAAEKARASAGRYADLPKAKNPYGKRFTCGGCGRTMKLQRSISRKGDAAYFTFKCPTFAEHGSRGCSDVKMRKADVDQAVFSFIRAQMDVFLDMDQILGRLPAVQGARSDGRSAVREDGDLRQRLDRKKAALGGLYADLKEGLLTREEYDHHRTVLLSDIAALEARMAQSPARDFPAEEQLTAAAAWRRLVKRFYGAASLSPEMVDAFVESMVLGQDNTLEIKLSYTDGFAALLAASKKLRGEVA